MYGWIWRHLPFGLPGRIIGSVLLAGILGAVLWFTVFPTADEWLPFGDVQVTSDGGQPAEDTSPAPASSPTHGPSPTPTPKPSPTPTRR